MSPRKKKDPIAQLAADAAVAYAIESIADDPRGAPETLPVVEVAPVVHGKPCAIESAPDGAKCVVSRTEEGKAVRLLTPDGVVTLDKDDLMYTLPAGAKIRRVSATEYEAYRLGEREGAIFTVSSARVAVERFLEAVA